MFAWGCLLLIILMTLIIFWMPTTSNMINSMKSKFKNRFVDQTDTAHSWTLNSWGRYPCDSHDACKWIPS